MATTTTTKPSAAAAVLAALTPHTDATATELAEAAGVGHSTATKALVRLEGQGKIRRTPGGREGGRRLPDRWALVAEPATRRQRVGQPMVSGQPRLAKGALRTMVLEHLLQHRGEQLTPSAVAKALGHSGGAVANALVRLARDGEVIQVSSAPRRYIATS